MVFTSDVPLDKLALGSAVLEIARYDAPAGGVPARSTLFAGAVPDVPRVSAPYTLTTPPLPDLSQGPDIAVVESTRTFYVRLDPAIGTGMVKVIDPLQRSAQVLFEAP